MRQRWIDMMYWNLQKHILLQTNINSIWDCIKSYTEPTEQESPESPWAPLEFQIHKVEPTTYPVIIIEGLTY